MIGRWTPRKPDDEIVKPKGFDDYDLCLGDVMRGERATLGKSLLDVQRELRIKASYIAAIENADPTAFETPGFIAGYVRSYARYLGMDPDQAFEQFCAESGFTTAHGMSEGARSSRKPDVIAAPVKMAKDPLGGKSTTYIPVQESLFSRIEPGAIGSLAVLAALIGAIGFGGYSVLQEIQQVQLAPVDQTPVVLSDLDPLDSATPIPTSEDEDVVAAADPAMAAPTGGSLDRLYRPQALDVPVLVARDAPISTLDPSSIGTFASIDTPQMAPQSDLDRAASIAAAVAEAQGAPQLPQVVEKLGAGVTVVAVRPSWVRVRAADGTTIYEGIMNAGDTYAVPQTQEAPVIRVGESGAIYFAVNGETYGPAGPSGSVTRALALAADNLTDNYQVADITRDQDLARVVAELQSN